MVEEGALVDEAATKLKRTVREGRPVDAAQVKVVGLDEVRAAAGANWPRMRNRIHTSAMNFLQNWLAPDDVVIPCGDGFLIVYAQADEKSLDENCRQIADAMNAFFIGEEGMERLRAKVSGQKMPAESLNAALAQTQQQQPQQTPPPQRRTAHVPIWSASREAFACYCVTPIASTKRMGVGYNPSFRERGRHDACDFLSVDLQIVDDAIKTGTQASARNAPFHIGYSVHATTLLSSASRRIYRDKIATIPQNLGSRLIARIAEIEPGTPAISLCDWVSLLHVKTPRVTLEFHSSDRNFDGLEASRACAAGFALPNVPDNNGRAVDPAYRIGLITRWRAALRRRAMHMFLDNVVAREDVLNALSHQVDWLSGAAVWPPVDSPSDATRESRSALLERLGGTELIA